MGIRFRCHLCEAPLHVKTHLAMRRGICPKCKGRFRIPASSQSHSISLDEAPRTKPESFAAQPSVAVVERVVKEPLQIAQANLPPASETMPQIAEPITEYFFVRPPSGGEYGPADRKTIEEWITQRRVTGDSFICKLGTSDWRMAKEVFVTNFLFS